MPTVDFLTVVHNKTGTTWDRFGTVRLLANSVRAFPTSAGPRRRQSSTRSRPSAPSLNLWRTG